MLDIQSLTCTHALNKVQAHSVVLGRDFFQRGSVYPAMDVAKTCISFKSQI